MGLSKTNAEAVPRCHVFVGVAGNPCLGRSVCLRHSREDVAGQYLDGRLCQGPSSRAAHSVQSHASFITRQDGVWKHWGNWPGCVADLFHSCFCCFMPAISYAQYDAVRNRGATSDMSCTAFSTCKAGPGTLTFTDSTRLLLLVHHLEHVLLSLRLRHMFTIMPCYGSRDHSLISECSDTRRSAQCRLSLGSFRHSKMRSRKHRAHLPRHRSTGINECVPTGPDLFYPVRDAETQAGPEGPVCRTAARTGVPMAIRGLPERNMCAEQHVLSNMLSAVLTLIISVVLLGALVRWSPELASRNRQGGWNASVFRLHSIFPQKWFSARVGTTQRSSFFLHPFTHGRWSSRLTSEATHSHDNTPPAPPLLTCSQPGPKSGHVSSANRH